MSRSLENILSNHFNFRRTPLATINFSHLLNFKIQLLLKKKSNQTYTGKSPLSDLKFEIIFLSNHYHYFQKALATTNYYDEKW